MATLSSVGLSPDHIRIHLIDLTQLSQKVGYHGGLSLNTHAALLCEPYERVLEQLNSLVKTGIANPFGCAVTLCPIWYMKGISRDWDSYGGKGYGMSRSGSPLLEYTAVYNEAVTLAVQYPNQSFACGGQPSVEELVHVREMLGLPIVLAPMSDDECLICISLNEPRVSPVGNEFVEPEDDDDADDDDFDYADPDEFDPNYTREVF